MVLRNLFAPQNNEFDDIIEMSFAQRNQAWVYVLLFKLSKKQFTA